MSYQETVKKAILVIKIALRFVPWASILASLIILLISLSVIVFKGQVILFEPNPWVYSIEIGIVSLTIVYHFRQGRKLLLSSIQVQPSKEAS